MPPILPSELSNTSSTDAVPTGLRAAEPLNTTSAMFSPRKCLADSSPMTQRTASMMFDLPQPLGPTTPVRFPGKLTWVGSTKDLKPASLILVNRILKCLPLPARGGECASIWLAHLARRSRTHAVPACHRARDFCQSIARARLHHPDADSGVHVPVSEDRPAGFRDSRARIRR